MDFYPSACHLNNHTCTHNTLHDVTQVDVAITWPVCRYWNVLEACFRMLKFLIDWTTFRICPWQISSNSWFFTSFVKKIHECSWKFMNYSWYLDKEVTELFHWFIKFHKMFMKLVDALFMNFCSWTMVMNWWSWAFDEHLWTFMNYSQRFIESWIKFRQVYGKKATPSLAEIDMNKSYL